MIYLYDQAIADDLKASFVTDTPNETDPAAPNDPVIKFLTAEQIIGAAAEEQNDNITFPLISLTRKPGSVQIDRDRINFTRAHFGVASVLEEKTNNLYYEQVLPITLEYALTVVTTNTVHRDELIREILFKYINMYFLTIKLPYECSRKVRFGVSINSDTDIDYSSSSSEYVENGSLYQAIIPLKCEGCVYVNYTPAHLVRTYEDLDQIFIKGAGQQGLWTAAR